MEVRQKGATADESGLVRVAMAFALNQLGHNYIGRIADQLTNDKVSAQARDMLIEIGPSVSSELYARLQESQPAMREAVADVLGMTGDQAALPSLEAATKDKDPDVATAARRAIEHIKARG